MAATRWGSPGGTTPSGATPGPPAAGAWGMYVTGEGVRILGNEVTGTGGGTGIGAGSQGYWTGAQRILVADNVVHHVGGAGIQVSGTSVAEGNEVFRAASGGIAAH